MSLYLDKSKKNLTASRLLINNSLPDASVNCSYYALVQQMLHVLFIKEKINRQTFEAERRINKDGTHGYAEKLIKKQLVSKDFNDFKWFQREFPILKKQRETADYEDVNLTKDDAEEALTRTNSLINILVQYFK